MKTSAIKSAVSDVLLLSSPLLICLIVFAFFGDNWKNFIAIPEWSFLSAFLFIETLKEAQSQKRNTAEEIMDGKSAICTYSALILTASAIMVLAFASSRGYLAESIKFNDFALVQAILLITAVILSLKVKYEARKLEV